MEIPGGSEEPVGDLCAADKELNLGVGEKLLKRLSEEVDRMARVNLKPIVLCTPNLRRHVRRFTERLVPQLAVISLNEIPTHVSLRAFGVIKV